MQLLVKTGLGHFIKYGFCALLALLLSATTRAESNDGQPLENRIIQVRSENWYGYSEAGEGYLFLLLRAAFEPLGYQLQFKFCPWKRCVQDVMESRADIIVSVYDDESFIGQYMQVNRHPIFIERIAVAFKAQRWPQWQGQQTMSGGTLGMLRGYDMHKELVVPVKLQEVSSDTQLWKLLVADRVDFIIEGITPLKAYGERFTQYPGQFRIEHVYQKESYLGFGRSERAKTLLQQFDTQLRKLYQQGEVQALQKQLGLDWLSPIELQ